MFICSAGISALRTLLKMSVDEVSPALAGPVCLLTGSDYARSVSSVAHVIQRSLACAPCTPLREVDAE